ncbi:peptidoglycan endopeptidase [Arthrobacter crusticola]|uniref:Peptidoglycan endopeptidase n=1 Tax=Arthrobacter crusticola TaxID=2547960 RepID=A0A4R5TXB0_9MICC|nr:C40 family peptidase [Arthrobacter crusticola]TDK25780.1 peptidoglycan endopeptidase [Arthrobacter crusticola]
MSMATALERIQQIQGTLGTLNSSMGAPASAEAPGRAGKVSPAAAAEAAANASMFAEALSSAGVTAGGTAPAVPAVPGLAGPAAPAAGGSEGGSASPVEAAARKYLGLPYIWGGNDPAAGLDCSSFVQHVFRDLGYELPRTTWDQVNQGTPVASMAEARPGDLLFTFNTGHVSIYLGNGKAVDAPQPGSTIQIRDAWENDSNVTAIRRILPAGSSFGAASAGAAR